MASWASLPTADISIVVPFPAPSIMSPMMERPDTEVPSLITVISLVKCAAASTNFAEARA